MVQTTLKRPSENTVLFGAHKILCLPHYFAVRGRKFLIWAKRASGSRQAKILNTRVLMLAYQVIGYCEFYCVSIEFSNNYRE